MKHKRPETFNVSYETDRLLTYFKERQIGSADAALICLNLALNIISASTKGLDAVISVLGGLVQCAIKAKEMTPDGVRARFQLVNDKEDLQINLLDDDNTPMTKH